jgi:hypothetical protein
MEEAIDRIKYHVDRVKQEKSHVETKADMPGIELLYEKYNKHNASVHAALLLWEHYPEVSTEQALVQLVDALVKENAILHGSLLNLHQTSTRPVVISGNATGSRIITGHNNKVTE